MPGSVAAKKTPPAGGGVWLAQLQWNIRPSLAARATVLLAIERAVEDGRAIGGQAG